MELGLDPDSNEARSAITRVSDGVRWEHADEPYFDGEVEPCISGVALSIAAYFGVDGSRIVGTILDGELDGGGWNCWAEYGATVPSFHSTICVIEGLLAWERGGHSAPGLTDARRRSEEYLLERRLFRRKSDGSIVDPRFTMFSTPTRWFYDVLRGLEYFRAADRRDARLEEAVELVRAKQRPDGRWLRDLNHEGPVLVDIGYVEGQPSRWVTLKAQRVLDWWDGTS